MKINTFVNLFKKFDDKFTLKFLHLLSDLLNSKGTVDKFASNGGPSFSKNYDIPVPNKQTSNDHFDSDDDKEIEVRVQTNNDYNKVNNGNNMNSKKTDTHSENRLFSKNEPNNEVNDSNVTSQKQPMENQKLDHFGLGVVGHSCSNSLDDQENSRSDFNNDKIVDGVTEKRVIKFPGIGPTDPVTGLPIATRNVRILFKVSLSGVHISTPVCLFVSFANHHLFLKRPSFHAQLGLDVPPEMKPLHVSLNSPFRMHTKHLHILLHTFIPSLPFSTRTSHPCHHHISIGRHPIIPTLMFHMPKI